MLSGGYNSWRVFRVHDTGSAYQIQKADGSAVADALTDTVFNFTKMEDNKLTPKTDGSLEVDLTQYDDLEGFDTFLDAWATPVEGTSQKEVKFIDGSSSLSSGSTDCLLLIAAGPIDVTNNSKRKTRIVLLDINKDSGAEQYKDGEYIKPGVKATSRKAKYALTIPEILFDPVVWKTGSGGIGAQTLPIGKHFKRVWLKTPAST